MNDEPTLFRRSPFFWAGLMFGAYGVVAGLQLSGAVEGAAATLLYFVPIGLLLPMYRSAQAMHRSGGWHSSAVSAYNKRFMLAMFGYLLGLGIAAGVNNSFELTTATSFSIAMLPVVPILGMIWAMALYLIEETDEYLRYRATIASLFGLAILLGMASFWGFLETFGVAPHAPGWLAFPIWAAAMGFSQCWMSIKARTGDEGVEP